MIKIEFCPQGEAVSDWELANWFERNSISYFASNADKAAYVQTSSTLAIKWVRLAILRREIPASGVTFVYMGEEQVPDDNAMVKFSNPNFANADEQLLEKLLDAIMGVN